LASSDLLQRRLSELLDDVAAETPAPGAGAVAAVAVAFAAALVEMTARFSGRWEGSAETLAAAETLRARVAPLAQADGEAYADYLAARRRGDDLAAVQSRVVAIPLEVAECAAAVADLAAALAEHGNPNLRGEVIAAAHLASTGAAIASRLVELNLEGVADERAGRARRLAVAAAGGAARTTTSLG
jgi:formiminotetrahydrofolate cyclodeaminase